MEERLAKETIENARLWIARLEKNEKAVGVQTLQTEYRKGYATLISRAREAVNEAVVAYIMTGIHGVPELKKLAERFIQKEKEAGLFTRAWNCARKEYSVDAALNAAYPSFLRLTASVYQPYWLKHIKIINGRFFNDLIGAFWRKPFKGNNGYWEGAHFTMVGLPPTENLCKDYLLSSV